MLCAQHQVNTVMLKQKDTQVTNLLIIGEYFLQIYQSFLNKLFSSPTNLISRSSGKDKLRIWIEGETVDLSGVSIDSV